jgi:hypothetical protein
MQNVTFKIDLLDYYNIDPDYRVLEINLDYVINVWDKIVFSRIINDEG